MQSTVRLAILEADVPLDQTRAEYGSYGGVFSSFLHKGADAIPLPRHLLHLTGWNVVDVDNGQGEGVDEDMGGRYGWKRKRGYPRLEDVDAILSTGSRYNSFENDPWILRLVSYIKLALQTPSVRIIGVCFGHQILARALGVTVSRSEGPTWEVSVCPIIQTVTGQAKFGGKPELLLHQMHKDIVHSHPPGVEGLGRSPACDVQGMYRENKFITVQGHPEFTEKIMTEIVEYRFKQRIFGEKEYKYGIENVGRQHDGIIVAAAFVEFLLQR